MANLPTHSRDWRSGATRPWRCRVSCCHLTDNGADRPCSRLSALTVSRRGDGRPLASLRRPRKMLWAFSQTSRTIASAPNFAYGNCVVRKIAERISRAGSRSWRAAALTALAGGLSIRNSLERFSVRFLRATDSGREAQLSRFRLGDRRWPYCATAKKSRPLVDRVERGSAYDPR